MGKMGKTKIMNAYSIKYHKKRLKNFWKRWTLNKKHYRTIHWWLGAMKLVPLRAGNEATSLVKDLVRMGVLDNKFSLEEAYRLWDMLKSEDEEDKYMALSILEGYYPKAFIKEKSIVTLV